MKDSASPLPPPVAEADAVGRTYESSGRWTSALSEVSAVFHGGRLTALAGPSGSGKSTLLRILAGLDLPTEGEVTICGTEVSTLNARRRRRLRRTLVAFLFQKPSDNLVSYLDAGQHLRVAAEMRNRAAIDTAAMLERVGLGGAARRRPHELSGGEQQRLAVAQALVGSPPLLLLDEPTAELDLVNGENVVELLRSAVTTGTAVVVASHDPVVVDAADDVVELLGGKVRT